MLFGKDKEELEYNDEVSLSFSVSDNVTTEVAVPVKLHEDAYIKDYRALKKIYDALDGPNWYYQGDEWPVGSTWNFDKDIDLNLFSLAAGYDDFIVSAGSFLNTLEFSVYECLYLKLVYFLIDH